jgi:hypothetical protein
LYLGNESIQYRLEIDFDAPILGYLPTAAGMVLTTPAFAVEFYDRDGNLSELFTNNLPFSADPNDTSDDRFVGATNPAGISKLVVTDTIGYFESRQVVTIDHFQYGLLVPEPASWLLLALAAAGLFALRRASERCFVRQAGRTPATQ